MKNKIDAAKIKAKMDKCENQILVHETSLNDNVKSITNLQENHNLGYKSYSQTEDFTKEINILYDENRKLKGKIKSQNTRLKHLHEDYYRIPLERK